MQTRLTTEVSIKQICNNKNTINFQKSIVIQKYGIITQNLAIL